MKPSEIIHRLRIEIRDRFLPPAYCRLHAEEVFQRLFPQGKPVVRLPLHLDQEYLKGTLREAEGLLRGEWSFFGRQVEIGDPPNWRKNLWTGQEWHDLPASKIDYRDITVAGGVKYAWEHGRLTYLPSLAIAAKITSDTRYAELAQKWLDDFAEKNPLGHGIQHTSGIEQAVRILSSAFALAIHPLKVSDAVYGLLAQQALYLRDHLSLGSSANNHLLAEYAGMATLGAAFPEMSDSADLLMEGAQGLERELLRQMTPDGCSVEQSFGYIPFLWELFLYPLRWAESAGYTVAPATKDRLRESLEFARFLRISGSLPQIGDEDDGRILLPNEQGTRLDLVGNALATWLDAPALSINSQAIAHLLFGKCTQPAEASTGHRLYRGGYEVWRTTDLLVTLDVGPLGWGSIAAHGHADALSVTLAVKNTPVIIDPGCYSYQEDPEGRDRFRSTPYHSTVNFSGRSSSEMLGPFLWGRRAEVKDHECKWYTGERHIRQVEVEENTVAIHDHIEGAGAEFVLVLHPACTVTVAGSRATVQAEEASVVIDSQGLSPWRLEEGEYSKRIGHKEPTTRLCANFLSHASTVRIEIE